jgi:hypothetical protein
VAALRFREPGQRGHALKKKTQRPPSRLALRFLFQGVAALRFREPGQRGAAVLVS